MTEPARPATTSNPPSTDPEVATPAELAAAESPVGPVSRWAIHRRLYDWVISFAHRKHSTAALFGLSLGAVLFNSLACVTCHTGEAGSRGPSLAGVFGHEVELQGGGKVVADEAYLRESIVNPQARVVAGFPPIMPPFQGMVSEEQLLQLIAYLKSLKGPAQQK